MTSVYVLTLRRVIGDLSDPERVMQWLDLPQSVVAAREGQA